MKAISASLLAIAAYAVPMTGASDRTSTLRRRTQSIFSAITPFGDSDSSDSFDCRTDNTMVTITNLAFQQPFGGFFVMTHNSDETPLFTLGGNSSAALANLAENGDPSALVAAYNTSGNADYVGIQSTGAPYFGGDVLTFTIPYNDDYPYLTVASMAINTNDCFVALNGAKIKSGVIDSPGYDSGSEENNELCSSIPGPACSGTPGNVASGNGEGFVHVHRGFFGVGDLSQAGYDWRNPMASFEISPV